MKIEEMTDNLWKFWLLNKFSLLISQKMSRKQYGEYASDVRDENLVLFFLL